MNTCSRTYSVRQKTNNVLLFLWYQIWDGGCCTKNYERMSCDVCQQIKVLVCWTACYPGPIIPNNEPKKLGTFLRPQLQEVELGSEISGVHILLYPHGNSSISAHVNGGLFAQFTLRVTRVLGVSRGSGVALWLWGRLRLACRGGRRLHDLASGGATPSVIT